MPVIQYILFPGSITSRVDGQHKYVCSHQLARCYGVQLARCLIIEERDRLSFVNERKLPELWPRFDGDYRKADGSPNILPD